MSWYRTLRRALGLDRMTASDIEMLSCAEVADLLYEYIDEELDEVTRARVSHHLDHGQCECKRALLFELAFLRKVRGSLAPSTVPEDLRRRIIASLTD